MAKESLTGSERFLLNTWIRKGFERNEGMVNRLMVEAILIEEGAP